MRDHSQKETDIELLGRVANVATALQEDVRAFSLETGAQVSRFKADAISLEDVCFWHKSLAGAFFAYADGLCFVLREAITENAHRLNLSQKQLRQLAPESRTELERLAPMALRHFARLFSAEVAVDTSTEDFRGFRALTEAREAFAHLRTTRKFVRLAYFRPSVPHVHGSSELGVQPSSPAQTV